MNARYFPSRENFKVPNSTIHVSRVVISDVETVNIFRLPSVSHHAQCSPVGETVKLFELGDFKSPLPGINFVERDVFTLRR